MIWPFQTLRYTTQLRPDQVIDILRERVGEPPKWFKRPPQEYIGELSTDSFTIRRNVRGRNSFLPYLHGSISSTAPGSEVSVQFRIHQFVIVFCIVWEAFVLSAPWQVAVVFSAFLIVLTCIGYIPEAANAERDLKRMIPPVHGYSIAEVPELKQ